MVLLVVCAIFLRPSFVFATVKLSYKYTFADTQGHPLFIIQTLKSLSEEDDYTLRAGVPTGVRDLIRARLSRLGSHATALCRAGAILGAGSDFDRLCCVADLNERDGLPALEELLRRGLLREIGHGESQSIPTYGFSHDRIREVAGADLSAARRRVLHRRALEAGGIPPAELVRHALAAGLLERGFHLSLRAGEEAVAVFALRNAIAHYDQADALMAHLHLPIADRCALYLARGRAYELASEWQAARTDFQYLLALAREMRHVGLESTALTRLAAVAARGSLLCADYAEVEDWHMAYAQVQRTLPVRAANPTVTPFAGQTRWYETEALIRGGAIASAIEDVQHFDRQIGGRDRYRIAYLRAMAVLQSGETDQANIYRQAAVAPAESIGLPGELWALYAGLGQASQAAAIIQSLATAIDDEAIRARFLVEPSRLFHECLLCVCVGRRGYLSDRMRRLVYRDGNRKQCAKT
jgi:hypothetical protein